MRREPVKTGGPDRRTLGAIRNESQLMCSDCAEKCGFCGLRCCTSCIFHHQVNQQLRESFYEHSCMATSDQTVQREEADKRLLHERIELALNPGNMKEVRAEKVLHQMKVMVGDKPNQD